MNLLHETNPRNIVLEASTGFELLTDLDSGRLLRAKLENAELGLVRREEATILSVDKKMLSIARNMGLEV